MIVKNGTIAGYAGPNLLPGRDAGNLPRTGKDGAVLAFEPEVGALGGKRDLEHVAERRLPAVN